MKKTLIALAVLGAFASAASAQSSVTLSGMLDVNVNRQGQASGTGTVNNWTMGKAGSAFDNFTLSGKEDLGGGMNAFFAMNHRFNPNNGTVAQSDPTATTQFYRQLWVGLGGGFGDVRLGRMLMPLQEMNGVYDIWYGGYTVASTHTGGGIATARANNAIYYRSPSMSGLSVHLAIAAGEGQLNGEMTGNGFRASAPVAAAPATGKRPEGLAVNYAAGPLKLTAAYDKNYYDYKTTGIYGQYNFGVLILNAQFEDGDQNIGTTAGTIGPKEKMKAFSVSADIPFGAFTGKVGYLRLNSNLAGGDANKFGIGGEYNLSKRTLLYTDIGKWSGDRASAADKVSKFDLGIRHKF
jgi:predicted porin